MKQLDPQTILVAAKLRGEENSLLTYLASLYEQGVRLVRVHFSGGGDSGDIDSVDCYDDVETKQSHDKLADDFDEDGFRDALHALITSKVTHDWYNNEGGGGEININLETCNLSVRSYYYETVEHDGDCFEEPIRGTEELS